MSVVISNEQESFTVTGPFAERLALRLEPWWTPDLGRKIMAIAAPIEPILELAEEHGEDGTAGYVPAWGELFEVENCPPQYLGYLAQFVGVALPKEASTAEKRALIKEQPASRRGTRTAVEAAIKSVIGSAPFTIQERTEANGTAGAYHFNVIVGTGQSSAALVQAITEVKPAGVFFTVIEVSGAWINVAGGKKWSEATALEKWSEAKEGAP